MLNERQSDLCELIGLVRAAKNFDATMVAATLIGKRIPAGADAGINQDHDRFSSH